MKDERNLDKFDPRLRRDNFKGLEGIVEAFDKINIPADWLRALAEKYLTEEERAKLDALGWDELMATLRKRLEEQRGRHEGGKKWIGTAGTSPFGSAGDNPSGMRFGDGGERKASAKKVWDRREYKDLDGNVELGTRNIKIALRRLRKFARTGAPDEFDLDSTIDSTARHAYLDIRMRPERRNAVKVLLFLDIGGSMDWHIKLVEELFSAARTEFKHMQHFYFHNCIYEGVWKTNRRRFVDRTPTWQVLNTFAHDYKVIFVGDATMSSTEITHPGAAVEYTNDEAGAMWMERVTRTYPHLIWLNPVPEKLWADTESVALMRKLVEDRMYPLTLAGLEAAMRELLR